MNVPTCGRMVHYTLSEVDSPKAAHRVRPAIVIDVIEGGTCNLHVMTNGGRDDLALVHWKGEVTYDERGEPGTWRWPPIVGAKEEEKTAGKSHRFEPAKKEEAKPAKKKDHYVAHPPPGFGPVAEEKPITDRYATVKDLSAPITKPEATKAPDGLPFSYGTSDKDDEEDHG